MLISDTETNDTTIMTECIEFTPVKAEAVNASAVPILHNLANYKTAIPRSLRTCLLKFSVMMTPINDFDIFNQIARLRLRVCTRSAELDFVHGPKTGSQRYDHQFDTKTFENSLETCSAFDTSTAIGIGQLCI
jgi:hypothetical protein